MIVNGRIVQAYPVSRARCPKCGRPIRGLIGMRDGGRLDTCEGKVPHPDPARRGASKSCGQRLFIRAGLHGWVAVALVNQDEWERVADQETYEEDPAALRELGIPQAAFAALAAVGEERESA